MVEITSNTKKLLLIIASVLMVLTTLQLIFSISHNEIDQLGWSMINFLIDFCFIVVIVKQHQFGLKVYCFIFAGLACISALVLMICVYANFSTNESLKQDLAEKTVSIITCLVLYSLLTYLVHKYIHQVDYNEGYTIA